MTAIPARLIDCEGVTVANLIVPSNANGGPPWFLDHAVMPKLTCLKIEDPPEICAPMFKRVTFKLERRDGGGTWIYRQESPWPR